MKRIATYRDYVGELTVTYKRTEQLTTKITSSKDAEIYFRPLFEECMDDHEQFKILHMNNNNMVVNVHHVSSGTETGTLVDVKNIVRNALHINVKAVICCHNHPSGGVKFSQADLDVSKKIRTALEYFDIKCLDSLLITRETYKSMADEGLF